MRLIPSHRPTPRAVSVVAVATVGAVFVLAPAARAGLIDGSLNNLHVADKANVLGLLVNSRIDDLGGNNNANTRNEGSRNGAVPRSAPHMADTPRCTVTVTAWDPDGASGTVTVPLPTGDRQVEVKVPDQVPGTRYRAGDADHLAGTVTCVNPATGAVVGLLTLSDDEIAR